jgi:hypothetical protein
MPKDEFDFDDPMELSGVVLPTDESTTDAMCECFIEEYMRLGYDAHQVLALFKNPYYVGMRMVLNERGENFVRARISDVFAMWGKSLDWDNAALKIAPPAQPLEFDPRAIDPTGAAIPQLKH